jgi:hypothetical protein
MVADAGVRGGEGFALRTMVTIMVVIDDEDLLDSQARYGIRASRCV